MTAQPKLFATDDNDAKFRDYDEANPLVWPAFVEYALRMYHLGYRRISGKSIAELMRLGAVVENGVIVVCGPGKRNYMHIKGERVLTTAGPVTVKINNTYISYYVRRFVTKYPIYRHLFKLRRAQEDIRID